MNECWIGYSTVKALSPYQKCASILPSKHHVVNFSVQIVTNMLSVSGLVEPRSATVAHAKTDWKWHSD